MLSMMPIRFSTSTSVYANFQVLVPGVMMLRSGRPRSRFMYWTLEPPSTYPMKYVWGYLCWVRDDPYVWWC